MKNAEMRANALIMGHLTIKSCFEIQALVALSSREPPKQQWPDIVFYCSFLQDWYVPSMVSIMISAAVLIL